MARRKYKITTSDHWFAQRWIEKKIANPTWLGERLTFTAQQDFMKHHESAEELNIWSELWLSTTEWTQLKNAIRSSRRRARGVSNISVTMSRYAWSILDFWAKREGCTLSEVIENRLGTRNTENFEVGIKP